jgi:uncharacterized protein
MKPGSLENTMPAFAKNEPLTESELDRLERFLDSCNSGNAMNIESVDGFFAALIAGPEIVMPGEYLPVVFGGDTSGTQMFESLDEANEILGLLMRHWNDIAGILSRGDVHIPLLLEDENGVAHGNDWARGFIQGTRLCHDGWADLLNDDDHGGWMLPMLMLCYEHDEDPTMRPKPIDPQQREKIIDYMAAGLIAAYRYFRENGKPNAGTRGASPRNTNNKIGRNDPCPCGSGKKFKRCCGGATVH